MIVTMGVFYSFIQPISIAPLQVHYYSEALPTQHGYCVGVSHRSDTGNCEWITCPRSLHGSWSEMRTRDPIDEGRRIYQWATTPHIGVLRIQPPPRKKLMTRYNTKNVYTCNQFQCNPHEIHISWNFFLVMSLICHFLLFRHRRRFKGQYRATPPVQRSCKSPVWLNCFFRAIPIPY